MMIQINSNVERGEKKDRKCVQNQINNEENMDHSTAADIIFKRDFQLNLVKLQGNYNYQDFGLVN